MRLTGVAGLRLIPLGGRSRQTPFAKALGNNIGVARRLPTRVTSFSNRQSTAIATSTSALVAPFLPQRGCQIIGPWLASRTSRYNAEIYSNRGLARDVPRLKWQNEPDPRRQPPPQTPDWSRRREAHVQLHRFRPTRLIKTSGSNA
jgi:hypothetical protein